MALLSNTPSQLTMIQLEARKSFSLGLWFKTMDEGVRNVVDITGATLMFTLGKPEYLNDPTVLLDTTAQILAPEVGYARLDIQAAELDLAAAEYPYILVLLSAEGYSMATVKGYIEILDNPSLFDSNEFDGGNPPQSLTVELSERNAITVKVNALQGGELAIGTVETLEPGEPAAAEIEGAYPYQVINLSIPKGVAGADGVGDPPALEMGTVVATGPGEDPSANFTGTGTDLDPYQLNLELPPVAEEQVEGLLELMLPAQVPLTLTELEEKRGRALRTFWTAIESIATTPIDIFVGPSDSIGAGAYAGTFPKKFISIFRNKVRAAVQPSGVKGGAGNFNLGTSPLLQGDGFLVGVTGSTSTNVTDGLGRHSLNMNAGSELTLFFTGTSIDILYKKAPGAGSFTYTIDGGAPSGPVSADAAVDHVKHTISGLSSAGHVLVLTVSGATVTVESLAPYNGDETKGARVWSGAHSGFGASDFLTSQEWAESLDNIPNCKLVVLPIGSNSWYNGDSPADARADIEDLIAIERAHFGASVSIVLVKYYDRPAGAPNIPWDDWAPQVYDVIAAADDNVCVFDLGPIFGPLESNTDDRGGLTTALPGDYVHPTPAGHKLIGERLARFVLPDGIGQGIANGTLDVDKPVSTAQAAADLVAAAGLPYTAVGNFAGGAMSFVALPVGNYSLTAQGNLTMAPSGMPIIAAGRTATWYLRITQDATGSRTLTLDPAIKTIGVAPLLQTTPGAVDLIKFFFDGVTWWCIDTKLAKRDVGLPLVDNTADASKPVSTAQAAAIQLAQDAGDQGVVVATINSFSGAMNFAAFSPILGKIFNINLIGNATFNITGIPAPPASRGGSFLVRFNQDATGSRTLTLTGFKRAGGALVLTTTASASDLIRFTWDGTNWWATPVVLNGS